MEPEEVVSSDEEEKEPARKSKFKEMLMKQSVKNKNKKMMSIDQKIQRKADKNVSKAIVIKRLREEGNRNINDDFGLNYLPKGVQQTGINTTDLEIGEVNPNNFSVLNPNVNVLEEVKQTEDDDFNLGMR